MECLQCGTTQWDSEQSLAFICFEGGGDEYIESYFFCQDCNAYSVEVFHDSFLGKGTIHTRGPIPKSEGDQAVGRIKRCPRPNDKRCRCEVHEQLNG